MLENLAEGGESPPFRFVGTAVEVADHIVHSPCLGALTYSAFPAHS
jgi:hypothetical protein